MYVTRKEQSLPGHGVGTCTIKLIRDPRLLATSWDFLLPLDMDNEQYLGDGVYASYDGYQIWLAVNNNNNKVVALDSQTLRQLQVYIKAVEEGEVKIEHQIK